MPAPSCTLASRTTTLAQAAIRKLVFDPTENRVAPAATEVTTFTITVNDGNSDGTNNSTTVTSTSVNDAPEISSDGGGATATVNVAENTTTVTTVTSTDADTGDTKTFSISGGADSTKFGINSTSGVLTFNSAPDYENPTDTGDTAGNNTYVVEVQITDGDATDTQTITVTVTNDVAEAPTVALSVNPTAVAENGGTSTITATLSEAVSEATTVTIGRKNTSTATLTDDFTLSATTITIPAGSTTGTATLTAVDDLIVDVAETAILEITNVTGGESATEDGTQEATVTITDDEVPGFTVVESSGSSSVSESGTTDSFTVVLNVQPTGNVEISVTSDDTGEATVSASPLTFTAGDWDIPQTVTLTGVDDSVVDRDQTSTITMSIVDANSADEYDLVNDQTVSVTTTDDDIPNFTLSKNTATVSEDATQDTFTVVLDKEPAGDVVIDIASSDTGEVTVDKASLTFTNGDWNVVQTVTLTGVDDVLTDGNVNSTITLSIDQANSDDGYDGVANKTLTVTTEDNDNQAPAIGGVDTAETINDKATDTPFADVTITDANNDNVVVTVTLDTQAKGTFTANSLTDSGFTDNNDGSYSLASTTPALAQAAIRQLVFDPTENRVATAATETTTFTIAVNDGAAITNDSQTTVTVTSVDDDSVISGDTTGEQTEDNNTDSTGDVDVDDPDVNDTPSFTLTTINGTYGTLTLQANGNWTYTLDNSKDTIQSLKENQVVTDSITIVADDGTSKNIVITITGANGVAEISGSSTGTVTEGSSAKATGTLTITDEDTGEAEFIVQTNTTGNYGIFSVNSTGEWTYKLDNSNSDVQALGNNKTLTDSFSVESLDGTTKTVAITITGTNGGAAISGELTGSVAEDGEVSASGNLDISDEDSGEAIFVEQSGKQGTYGTFSISPNGAWSYTLDNNSENVQSIAANQTVTETFAVESLDGTTKSVTISITGANDDPEITIQESIVVGEDSGLSFLYSFTDIDNDTVTAIQQSGPSHGAVVIDGTTINYIPESNYHGTDSFVLTLTDNAGFSTEKTINVTVTPVHDPVTIADISNIADHKNFEQKTIPLNIENVEGGATVSIEYDQELLSVTRSGDNLIINSIADKMGVASIKVTVSDGESSDSTSFTFTILSLSNDEDINGVEQTEKINDDGSKTTTIEVPLDDLVIQTNEGGDSVSHSVGIGDQITEAFTDLVNAIVEIISDGVQTTYEDPDTLVTVIANILGEAIHVLDFGGGTTEARSEIPGARTVIEEDERGTRVVTTVHGVAVVANNDGSAEHIVENNGGSTSRVNANIPGANTTIRVNGDVETIVGETDAGTDVNGNPLVLRALAKTTPNGETTTRYVTVRKDTGEVHEVKSNTFIATSPYLAGNKVVITKENGKLVIKTTTPLSNVPMVVE